MWKRLALYLMVVVSFGCLPDPQIKLDLQEYLPSQLDDGWQLSTPIAEGLDQNKLDVVFKDLFSEDKYPTAQSLLIVRNGRLIAEAYCKDKIHQLEYHALQSATKSITSIVMGIAMQQDLITTLDIPVYNFIPEFFDDDLGKRSITIFNALTMQTGLAFVNDDHTEKFFNYSGSSLEYVLSKDLRFEPGSDFYYNDGDPQLISGIIQKVSGMTMQQFADKYLFNPLGIRNYLWETHGDGSTFGAVALWLTPRDMAKIGKLMVQNGSWNDQVIISEQWVQESTSIHANTNYGYYWWNYPGDPSFLAEGRGEQIIYVNQPANIVVVLTTDSFSDEQLSPGIRELIHGVMDAIVE